MTVRQEQILTCIRAFVGSHGYAPTMQEIGDRVNLAPSTAHAHVKALKRAGHLAFEKGKSRARAFTLAGSCPACGRSS